MGIGSRRINARGQGGIMASKLCMTLSLCLMLATACTSDHAQRPVKPAASISASPYIIDPIAQDNLYLRAQREALAQRSRVDQRGRADVCARYTSTHSTGLDAWVRAWCALRTDDADTLLTMANLALPYFEAMGHFRRQAELHLMMSVAASQLSLHHQSAASYERAQTLIDAAQLGLIASLDEPLPGDLPYLAGKLARERGGALRWSKRGQALGAQTLLHVAAEEYHSQGAPFAQAHALRESARWALDEGLLDAGALDLQRAIALEQDPYNPEGLQESALLFADMALARGLSQDALVVESWLVQQLGADYFPAPMHVELPLDHQQLKSALRSRASRQALLRSLRALRRDAQRARRPPAELIKSFVELPQLDALKGDGWELAAEAGQLLYEQGYLAQAQRYFQRAVNELELMRAAIPSLEQRQRFLATYRETYIKLIHTYVGVETSTLTQVDYRHALFLAGALKARGVLDLMAGAAITSLKQADLTLNPPPTPTQPLTTLLKWIDAQLKLWAASPAPRSNRSEALARMTPLVPKLPKDTALVEFLIGQRSGYVWVVLSDGELHMRRIAGRQRLGPMVERFMRLLMKPSLNAQEQLDYRTQAERLHVELLGPVQDLIASSRRLIIATDISLQELPFEALVRPTRDKTPHILIQDFELSYVPSSRALEVMRQRAQRPEATAPKGALLLGAPNLSQSALGLLSLSPELRGHEGLTMSALFPKLPGARQELIDIKATLTARHIPVNLRLGAQAQEQALRSDAKSAAHGPRAPLALMHIATHGITDAQVGASAASSAATFRQPALLLSPGVAPEQALDDGVLHLDEILRHQLHAKLVVLSGCATGRGWQTLGDGAFGLAGAFLVTGSEAVLASAWSVGDAPTSVLMRSFYKHLRPGDSPQRALRLAQLELIKDYKPADAPMLPPYYWAAFRVIGGLEP